jgi:hypothetical protein
LKTKILLLCLLGFVFLSRANAEPEQETRYLAFQIFTYYSSDPKAAQALSNGMKERLTPGTAALRSYVEDIKQRIGIVGDRQTRLAVMLGPLCFDQTDAEITQFIERTFDLALETDMAVGFHIDDCIFWSSRKDLWSDPQNVEALDWDGTPCTSRQLNYGKTPTAAPPQMCFNSKSVQHEVRQRSALIGKAIAAGVRKLEQLKRPEMFAGVTSGWETQMGSDLKTGKYLGYRALLNRGFSREHPPQDQSLELEKITQEFIELWTTGLAEAGVSPQKIYSHIAFLSRRAFGMGDNKEITYMRREKDTAYSQQNHFTPPSVAFGKNHRPGFSTYPQPGLFDDIYDEVAKHKQVGWASSEGTNMQPMSGPGQTGMSMETYLAKMFNHGATLTDIFSWGIGGERMKTMGYRVATENEEALQAYRKFLRGEPLIEAKETMSLMERLPPKIHQIQRELPAWMQKTSNTEAAALMQKMMEQMKAKDFIEVEKTADAILTLMGVSVEGTENKPPQTPRSGPPSDDTQKRLTEKVQRVMQGAKRWSASGRDPSAIAKTMEEKFKPLMEAGKVSEAEAELDRVLEQLNKAATSTESPTAPTHAAQDIAEDVREKLAHNIGISFLLFRTKAQAELRVTKEQKEKLDQHLRTLLPEAMQVLQTSNGERGKYNQKTHEEQAAVLKEILNDDQRTRLHQLELQKDGLFGPAWNLKELQITDEQRKRFVVPSQETQQMSQALMAEIQKGANPDAIRPKALQLRLDLEVKLEALLTDAQKKQWKEMLGKPVALDVIYGGL